MPWGAYFCFVSWLSVEQLEPGDTTTHTFTIIPWIFCQTKWFVFRGETYEYVPTPSGPVLPEDYPFYEPWGATLTDNYPWLPFTIPDIPTWTLEDGILTLTNPGFADCGIAYGPPWQSLPLLDAQDQPLRINTDNPDCSINSSSTQIHHELILRSATEVMSIYLAIGLGAEWDYYKPEHHTIIKGRDCGIYWIGTGHHDLNLYDLFVKFRKLFNKSTDPTGWCLNDIVYVMSLGEEHRTDYLKSNFLGFYHPLPDSLIPVLSPSVSCIFKYHHPGTEPFCNLGFEDYPFAQGVPPCWFPQSYGEGSAGYFRDEVNVQKGIYACKVNAVGMDFIARLAQWAWNTPYLNKTVKFTFNWFGGGRGHVGIAGYSSYFNFGPGWHSWSKTITFGSINTLLYMRMGTGGAGSSFTQLTWDNIKIEIL